MTQRLSRRRAGTLLWAVLALVVIMSVDALGSNPVGVAESAYELRMNGKLDEAKKILDDAVAANPGYAAGHFELARVKLHMALGNPREIAALLAEAQQSIDRAIEIDPDNVIYSYFAGKVAFARAYMAMAMEEPDAKIKAARCCEAFETAVRLKPDYYEAMLHLVELYGDPPEGFGGDRSKAEAYQSKLAKKDEIFGVKARSVLENVSVADWTSLRDKYPGNTDIIEELGKAYLRENNLVEAGKCFEEAVKIDPREAILFMDLGRYHIFNVIQAMESEDKKSVETDLAAAEKAIQRYLEFEHPAPIRAYALEMLAKVKRGRGEQDKVDKLRKEAQALDPYYSKATGCPPLALFTPPETIFQDHRYLARPF
ncbi:MAG: hypothetical protein KJ970_13445 [Candidatus Eisenbacteria bacterium]|uniref:Tetratricopeptide repeat protein n=1 Tax=Eiseniibacteriota bacterium TaxID=2212470 RepID=A0A948RYI0_UNCEI|nr:hypothetical protein [Candidatus Eisenbacteria bacterium]MBU1949872.1 hypothetical protein [Candidatus Eisenbacteria bacterium]MBU2691919.1 hypothetical protein [Candidatus Eisenbacteria bacterium]